MIGKEVSHYRIIRQLGAGGMGVIYLAEDSRLKRQAALKFLPPSSAGDANARMRFQREAEAASALDHPNIATIYEIGEWENQPFIAMAYYDGTTLHQRLEKGPLPVDEACSILSQAAAGVAAAHAAGIVHRDVKPANIMITRDGQVKILDFGIARLAAAGSIAPTRMTGEGTLIGTLSYLAPEVISGAAADTRADVWALGVILYEMLSGRQPFSGEQPASIVAAILSTEPSPITDLRGETAPGLQQLIREILTKDPAKRSITAAVIVDRLALAGSRKADSLTSWRKPIRARLAVPVALGVFVLVAIGAVGLRRTMNVRWARAAVLQVERLTDAGKYFEAFQLAQQGAPYLTDPAEISDLWAKAGKLINVRTEPPGATVLIKEVGGQANRVVELGQTPLNNVLIPQGLLQWRIEKAMFTSVDDLGPIGSEMIYTLDPSGSVTPPGMVRVSGANRPFSPFIAGLSDLPPIKLPDYWIDRFEITNQEFKTFVDAGGYERPELWQHEFIKNGRRLSWNEAMALFRDTTGRHGPATWEQGRYSEGEEKHPVTGVSWYEAAAYATFVGKALPTIYHWSMAAEQRLGGPVISSSNFHSRGLKAVGASGAMNRFGTYDMMGNVKEWCWNSASENQRYILGGAWDEPDYQAFSPDAQSPFERGKNFGFRMVKYGADSSAAAAMARIDYASRNFETLKAASDDVFNVYRRLFSYDQADLAARVERVDSNSSEWIREKVTFTPPYGSEREPAYLFTPRSGTPPYQTVVFFPGADAIRLQSSERDIVTSNFDFIIRSGRAVLYPIYKSTFERRDEISSGFPNTSHYYRDHVISWSKELGRALDYAATRPDIDKDRIAYYGISWGALLGPILCSVEPRLKTAIWVSGGFTLQTSLPEVDQIHFASRVRIPVLMLNGKYDFYFPAGTSQQTLFAALSTASKRWEKYESGHGIPRNELIKQTVAWLDEQFGEPSTVRR